MNLEQEFDIARSPERHETANAIYLGKLGDFNLGNPDGIPSRLAEATESDLELYGQKLLESTLPITDLSHDECIDGRCTLQNADGSLPEIRERFVGGTAANIEIARNAQASVVNTIKKDASLPVFVETVDNFITAATGKKRAAHTGGCGGANGAVLHNQLINTEPAILFATETVMDLPEVQAVTGVSYVKELGDNVRVEAGQTASWLEANGWDGPTYVDKAQKHEPNGVAVLRTANDKYNGHAEDAAVIDLRSGEIVTLEDTFVISGDAIVKKARALAGQRDDGYQQALIACFAKHMAVSKVLPSDKTPLYIICN